MNMCDEEESIMTKTMNTKTKTMIKSKFIKFIIFSFIIGLSCYWIVSGVSSSSSSSSHMSSAATSQTLLNMSRVANIPDWSTCLSGDTCASNNWICCVAPADTASGKKTCRPAYDASQCSSTTTTTTTTGSGTGTGTGTRVNDWSDCTNPSVDTCSSSGWVCCGKSFVSLIITNHY